MSKFSKLKCALYGAAGAIAPDVLILYSKRFIEPSLAFNWLQYLLATLMYVSLAALVATIYPYGRHPTAWKAFAVGVGLPLLISGLATLGKPQVLVPRGEVLPGSFVDLIALF